MTKYIFTAVIAAVLTFVYSTDPVDTPAPEVKQLIKLTTKHLPINRYFSDDDDDDLQVVQHAVINRRETSIKARTDISDDDDYELSDYVKDRLLVARALAMKKYFEIHG